MGYNPRGRKSKARLDTQERVHAQTHTHTHVCACTHTHAHTHVHTYTHAHTPTHIHLCAHTETHTYMHTCSHTCTHIRVHICTHTNIYTHAHTHTPHTCVHTHAHIHTYMHTHIYTDMRARTHTHTHTRGYLLNLVSIFTKYSKKIPDHNEIMLKKEYDARIQGLGFSELYEVTEWYQLCNTQKLKCYENVSCYQQKIGKWKPASTLPLHHLYSINADLNSYFIFSL